MDRAAEAGFDTHSWWLALKLSGFFDRKGQSASCLAFQRVALAATQRLGDGTAQALLHLRIGNTCVRIGVYHDAEHHLPQSLRLYGRSGDRIGQRHVPIWAWSPRAITWAAKGTRSAMVRPRWP